MTALKKKVSIFFMFSTFKRCFSTCLGCGVKLQKINPSLPGFLPPTTTATSLGKPITTRKDVQVYEKYFEKLSPDVKALLYPNFEESPSSTLDKYSGKGEPAQKETICQRCHYLRHYNSLPSSETESRVVPMDFKALANERALIIHLFDLVDFPRSIITDLDKYVRPSQPIIMAGTKLDLIPKECSPRYLSDVVGAWIKKNLPWMNQVKSVHLISTVTPNALEGLISKMTSIRRPRQNIYIMGLPNAGKSALVNALSRRGGGKVTTSPVPGTTIDMVSRPMSATKASLIPITSYDTGNLIDTPGINSDKTWLDLLTLDEWNACFPKKRLRSKTYRVKEGQSLFLGGLLRLDHVSSDEKQPILITISANIPPHITRNSAGHSAHITRGLSTHFGPPYKRPETNVFPDFVICDEKVFNETNQKRTLCDIVLNGIGWISPVGPLHNSHLRWWAPRGFQELIYYRKIPLIPDGFKGTVMN